MAPDDDSARADQAGGPVPHGPSDPIGRATHLVFGTAAVVLGAVGRGLLRLGTESDPPAAPPSAVTGPAGPEPATSAAQSEPPMAPTGSGPSVPGPTGTDADDAFPNTFMLAMAAVGLGAEVTRRVVGVAAVAAESAERSASAFMEHEPVPAAMDRFRGEVTSWGERGKEALRASESAAVDYGLDVVGWVVPRVIPRMDINAIVDQVDVQRIIDRVDLNEVVGRLDLNAIAERIDLEQILSRLNLAAITQEVLDQLDLTAIAQSVLDQLDLTDIAKRVIDELELGELIRESSATVTSDAVDSIRVGGMSADRFLGQVVDRILQRKNADRGAPLHADGSDDRPQTPTGDQKVGAGKPSS